MRETRIMIVTLMHRLNGPAIASWLEALRWAGESMPLVRFDHVILWGNPLIADGDGSLAITHKYAEARGMFLAGDYWAMITLEDDMIIPPDALVRLVNLAADGAMIGYGLYAFRHGLPKWNATTQINANGATFLNREPYKVRESWGQVIDVTGVGLGCSIIRGEVLERINFRKMGAPDSDWYLALDAQAAGMVQRCDLGLVCGHMSRTPSPRILWPDLDAPEMVRVEFT